MTNNTVKIAIIRFSSIGDIVLTSPIIRCLKKQLEGEVEIHFITKQAFKPLLECNPYISKIHCIQKSTNEIMADLKSENFDYIVDLHKNLRSSRIKKALPGLSFSFDKLNLEKWLLVNFKINRLPKIHIVDRYFKGVKALGIENDDEGLDYFLPETISFPKDFPKDFKHNYQVLVLGANHFTKKIPLGKMVNIIKNINQPLVLVGGKDDQEAAKILFETKPELVFNAVGITSLHESAYLIKEAKKIITPDTGMMHIAAAFQKEIISVWGNTVPDFGMYPYYKSGNENRAYIIQTEDLSCRPCSKIGYAKCPKGHFKCMENIQVESILEKL